MSRSDDNDELDGEEEGECEREGCPKDDGTMSLRQLLMETKYELKSFNAKLKKVVEDLDVLHRWRAGNGPEDPGADIRLDRLERWQRLATWVVGLLTTTTIGLLLTKLADVFHVSAK